VQLNAIPWPGPACRASSSPTVIFWSQVTAPTLSSGILYHGARLAMQPLVTGSPWNMAQCCGPLAHWSVTLMMRMMIPKAASGVIWAIPSLWHHTGLITPFQGFLSMPPTDVAPYVLFNQVLSPSCNQGTLQLHRNNPCLWNQRWEASKLLHFKNGSSGHLLWRR